MKNILVLTLVIFICHPSITFACKGPIACLIEGDDQPQANLQKNKEKKQIPSMLLIEDILPDNHSLNYIQAATRTSSDGYDEHNNLNISIAEANQLNSLMDFAYHKGFVGPSKAIIVDGKLVITSKPRK